MSQTNGKKNLLRIGELAAAAKVSTDTLRHYERKGVLAAPVRAANGYRLYAAEAIERVQLIRRALAVGFTLDEIARIFALRKSGVAPCREVYCHAADKLRDLDERLREMKKMRAELGELLVEWERKLSHAADKPAHLLEDLASLTPPNRGKNRRSNGENLRVRQTKNRKK